MFLAEKTVKNYVSALFAKLGMEHRTQAAGSRRSCTASSSRTHPGSPRP
jgi:DNA-binding CsgD family transcriptional regulator